MRLIKVIGDSMAPTLCNGDYLITIKAKPRSIRPGLIYVIQHSDLGQIIKRIRSQKNKRYTLSGDNPNSTPSSVIAPVHHERITQRVICVISKAGIKRI